MPAHTPVIDGLAAQGMRFNNAYAYPVCSSSRGAMLSGQHPRRYGLDVNFRERNDDMLARQVTLIPEMLAQSSFNYASGGVGKWHLSGGERESPGLPQVQGFDYFAGPLGNLHEADSYFEYDWYPNEGELEVGTTYLTTREVDEAINLVQTLEPPWFVLLSVHAPHRPWEPPPESLIGRKLAEDAPIPDLFDAMLEAADAEIGRLVAEVDLDDTLVMVIGDNGNPDEAVRTPSRTWQSKGSVYEGGVNVPWIAVGAGIPKGTQHDGLVHLVDVFPTVAESAGLRPARPKHPIDGLNLWPALLDEAPVDREILFTEHYYPEPDDRVRMARDYRYKLMEWYDGTREFYDLEGVFREGDPLDIDALSDAEQTAYDRLAAELIRLDRNLGDPYETGCN